MPAFPDVAPPEGVNVTATLTTGAQIVAYWDGAQWWTGVADTPDDVPLANSHVESWALIE